jgi:DNA polymerase I-like protein with 3'-5' exonuclease and polymerase domains
MRISEVFPSRFLKAANLRGTKELTIDSIETENFDAGPKPVLFFTETKQGLVASYAATDAAVLLPMHDVLKEKLAGEKLRRVSNIEFRCIPALAWMELAGVGVDVDAWTKLAEAAEQRAG